jgi:hypothetical protein
MSGRPHRAAAVLLTLAGLVGPLAAAPLRGAAPAFFIETITVENATHISPEIVISESLLESGNAYTEVQLRDAVHRIVRLPFILDAEFSLRKGTERDRYKLVIALDETRRWFFSLDNVDTYWSEPISVSGTATTRVTEASVALVGRRWAVGRQGLLFAALGGTDGTLTVGYQHFDLFDRNIFLSTSLSLADCDQPPEAPNDPGSEGCRTELEPLGLDPTASTWSFNGAGAHAAVSLGMPLSGNRSIQIRADGRRVQSGIRRRAFDPDGFLRFDNRRDAHLNISWVHNSVDDPVFPTAGSLIEIGLDARWLDAEIDRSLAMKSRQFGALFTGAWHRPWGRRQAFSLGLRGFGGGSTLENVPIPSFGLVDDYLAVFEGSVTLGHGLFLVQSRKRDRVRDLRWESSAEAFLLRTSPGFDQTDNPFSGLRLTSGLAYRNRWGVFRVGFSYLTTGQR